MVDRPSTSIGNPSRRAVLTAGAAGLASLAGCLVHGVDSGLRGQITVDGSDTVLPHSAAVAEEFLWRNNQVNIPIRGSGTGAGFQQFCNDATDIQNASRPITDEERERCADSGVDFVELPAVRDGIAVFTHPDNDWCEYLTVEELARIWESGSSVNSWADVRPDADWPDETIELFGRDPASGTFDTFTERITGERGNIRDDYSASADTNVIVRGVSGEQNALGWGGAGYYYENEGNLKLLGVEDPDGPGDGPVTPRTETIEDGTYTPLARDMYVYIKHSELAREVVREFTRFYFEEIEAETHDQAVEDGIADSDETLTWTQWAARKVGYYAATDDMLDRAETTLEDAISEYQ